MNGLKATYHELIEVFINAGKTTYVDAVCNILKEDSGVCDTCTGVMVYFVHTGTRTHTHTHTYTAGTFQPAEHQEISPDGKYIHV